MSTKSRSKFKCGDLVKYDSRSAEGVTFKVLQEHPHSSVHYKTVVVSPGRLRGNITTLYVEDMIKIQDAPPPPKISPFIIQDGEVI